MHNVVMMEEMKSSTKIPNHVDDLPLFGYGF